MYVIPSVCTISRTWGTLGKCASCREVGFLDLDVNMLPPTFHQNEVLLGLANGQLRKPSRNGFKHRKLKTKSLEISKENFPSFRRASFRNFMGCVDVHQWENWGVHKRDSTSAVNSCIKERHWSSHVEWGKNRAVRQVSILLVLYTQLNRPAIDLQLTCAPVANRKTHFHTRCTTKVLCLRCRLWIENTCKSERGHLSKGHFHLTIVSAWTVHAWSSQNDDSLKMAISSSWIWEFVGVKTAGAIN